jgi:hypothetical protein
MIPVFIFYVAALHTAMHQGAYNLCSALFAAGSARGRPRPYLHCFFVSLHTANETCVRNLVLRLMQRARRVVGFALLAVSR